MYEKSIEIGTMCILWFGGWFGLVMPALLNVESTLVFGGAWIVALVGSVLIVKRAIKVAQKER